MPKASAQWTCAKAGGFDMMASAMKGAPVVSSGLKHDSQQPCSILTYYMNYEVHVDTADVASYLAEHLVEG